MKRDLPAAGVVTTLGIVFLVAAWHLPPTPGQAYGAGFLPSLVATLMTMAGIALAVRALRRMSRFPTEPAIPATRPDWLGALLVVAVLVAYVVLVERLGFHLTAAASVAALVWAFTRRPWFALAFGGTAAVLVHLAFYGLFRVPLPWGLLQPLAW